MKNKVIGLVTLLTCILALTASTKSLVSDPRGLFDNQTRGLVNQENKSCQKTKTESKICFLSLEDSKDSNRIQPLKSQIIIAVALQDKKKSVQTVVGKGYQDPLTRNKCGNITRCARNKLRNEKAATFDSGIRLVFNVCTTLVTQKGKLSYDKNSLTQDELQKIDHPQSVDLVWGLVIAASTNFGLVLFKNFRKKK